ncbi:DDB1- and CUL4-associated factor 7-like [Centruroides sculpturatus]|uniref:DDB1- and CUL4-associated factor 7-like n=1 Tax=Centruroides sculpturatus TaxID=218467 RepID=UPI000C6CAD6D|nr:DDB1- and CUL4-associated factor 7-like [Centruroides sculpturatus]XP_023236043.1 DDB1- and CUL4-associated factor 7-like [Centruroides sculpturatus]
MEKAKVMFNDTVNLIQVNPELCSKQDFKILTSLVVPKITSNISGHVKVGKKCAFGSSCVNGNSLNVLTYDDDQLKLLHSVSYPSVVRRCKWIPDVIASFPEYLLVAGDDLCLYEKTDFKLTLRWIAPTRIIDWSPVTFCEWNYWNPMYISTVHFDGECKIWSLESEKLLLRLRNDFMFKKKSLVRYEGERVRMCFCHDSLEKCFVVYNDHSAHLYDMRMPIARTKNIFTDVLKAVKCSFLNPHYIAYLFGRKVSITDLRNSKADVVTFGSFNDVETATCFSWSPFENEIAIGTSYGHCIFWKPEKNNLFQTSTNDNIKYISRVEYDHSKISMLYISS